jgi:hypothetical protein
MINAKYMAEWARIDRRQWRFLEVSLRLRRTGYQSLKKLIRPQTQRKLPAQNAFARANIRRALGSELFDVLGADAPVFIANQEVYFLTVIDGGMVTHPGLPDELMIPRRAPSIVEIKSNYVRLLGDLNYVGMIEPALYVSTQEHFGVPRLVNYHVHCLVWGISFFELDRICREINRQISSLIPHAPAAEFKSINPQTLRNMLWYITKMPYEQHQLWVRPTTNRYRQEARGLNRINALRLCREMANYTLDDLAIGGGAGEGIVARALATARG